MHTFHLAFKFIFPQALGTTAQPHAHTKKIVYSWFLVFRSQYISFPSAFTFIAVFRNSHTDVASTFVQRCWAAAEIHCHFSQRIQGCSHRVRCFPPAQCDGKWSSGQSAQGQAPGKNVAIWKNISSCKRFFFFIQAPNFYLYYIPLVGYTGCHRTARFHLYFSYKYSRNLNPCLG